MDQDRENFCTLYVRRDASHSWSPEQIEKPFGFATYADAHRAQLAFRQKHRESVIRFHGDTGGGD